jgi:hypothetical protein
LQALLLKTKANPRAKVKFKSYSSATFSLRDSTIDEDNMTNMLLEIKERPNLMHVNIENNEVDE